MSGGWLLTCECTHTSAVHSLLDGQWRCADADCPCRRWTPDTMVWIP